VNGKQVLKSGTPRLQGRVADHRVTVAVTFLRQYVQPGPLVARAAGGSMRCRRQLLDVQAIQQIN
jgi:hypothetical protein